MSNSLKQMSEDEKVLDNLGHDKDIYQVLEVNGQTAKFYDHRNEEEFEAKLPEKYLHDQVTEEELEELVGNYLELPLIPWQE